MSSRSRWNRRQTLRKPCVQPILENLEVRVVLSQSAIRLPIQLRGWDSSTTNSSGQSQPLIISDGPEGYTPDQLITAYGLNNITFGSITGDGAGQTIAIVDAYDDPGFVNSTNANFSNSDLAVFDSTFGIPNPPSFTKYNQEGQLSPLPGTDPAGAGNLNGTWEMEEALDVEWAHALAPGANIDLVEADNDTDNNNLFSAVATAAALPGVSVVSMSWGLSEYDGEQSIDGTFTTPTGHQGVTFVAASGDQGSPGYYPAYSPNVLAVGGTTLNLNEDNTIQSEIAWSGSGGGTSQIETEPTYQEQVQNTGMRTIPDVAWDADPNTGVAVYDSYDAVGNPGAWLPIGGTSLASPSWAALIAIADQGRVLAHASTLDGPTQTLHALYFAPSADFNDITQGSNGGFEAGIGYDEVTGLGTPKANLLIPDLVSYGAATQMVVTAQPPSNVIVNEPFGVAVSAENVQGDVDPGFSGSVTIALKDNPTGANLGGTLTVKAVDGVAVFDGLTLDKLGSGYTFSITNSTFGTITTDSFNIIANPTPGSGTYYPVPTDASLRSAINEAMGNGDASNTIVLSTGTYILDDKIAGQIVIENTSSLPDKTLTIVGQGETNSIIKPGNDSWTDRIFEVLATSGANVTVVFQDLAIEGGYATDGGSVGGTAALGGGILIDGGTVRMTQVAISNNQAQGARGANGKAGAVGKSGAAGQAGGNAGDGADARGGGIYLAAGSLTLDDDLISNNQVKGGPGGSGGTGGNQIAGKSFVARTGVVGGNGGNGGSADGGGVYVDGGTLLVAGATFATNQAIGGDGGKGGLGGNGVLGKHGGTGGNGGQAGPADGGGIYLAKGNLTIDLSTLTANSAEGGAGGQGGTGGPGSSLLISTSIGITLSSGSIFGSQTSALTQLFQGGAGGNGGRGGDGSTGDGGGVYVGGGTLTLFGVTLGTNQAVGGDGGLGGKGGTGGLGSIGGIFGTGTGTVPIGGTGGTGGSGGSGSGGGFYLAGGTITLNADTISGNIAKGGNGGTGGVGGNGGFAGGLSFTGSGSNPTPSNAILMPTHRDPAPRGVIGGSGGGHGGIPQLSFPSTQTGITGLPTGGPGGDGGDGGMGKGGAIYVAGGTLTLYNDTIADNSVQGGSSGTGGKGGKGGSLSLGNGPKGSDGNPGDSNGGAFYITGGSISFYNSTVALNKQVEGDAVGGVIQVAGTVTATSTLFAGNGTIDYSGPVDAQNCLFQTTPINGSVSKTANLIGDNPLLATAGLASNGGPTQTIALQSNSPVIDAGVNPEDLFTDQRGYAPRTGPNGTDIGAYQHDATADTTSPTASLNATDVTSSNAATLNPYSFTVTYSDNTAVAASTLAGVVVEVSPPGGVAAIVATVVSTQTVGSTDKVGDAQGFTVTYEITPPGGAWTTSDNGTYTVSLIGAPVTDLSGNATATGTLGTFTVDAGNSQADTNTSITANPTASVYGQSVTFTATVTVVAPGTGTPTGTVAFKEGSTTLDTETLGSTGTVSFTTSALAIGSDAITAVYSGDPNFVTSSSSTTETVSQASTNTAITANPTTSAYGQSVTFTASVTVVAPGGGTPTGTVAFKEGSTTLDTETLGSTGVVSFTTSALGIGSDTITAVYSGDPDFLTSSSSTTESVGQTSTSTSITANPSSSVYGQSVTFTATVAVVAPGTGTPTGTVAFKEGSTTLDTETLGSTGTVSFTTSALGVGSDTITAVYSGDPNFVTSSSSTTETVSQASTNTAITANPTTSAYGQSVTFTATVTVAAPGTGTPTGTVAFKEGSTTLDTETLESTGIASFTTSALGIGSDTITAVYSGDPNFVTSSSSATETVSQASTNTAITANPTASAYGQSVTFTASVAVVAPGGGTPTGTVAFKEGSTTLDTETLGSTGTVSFTTSALAIGSDAITAVYSGDPNFVTSSSSTTETVSQASTNTAITANPTASAYGQSVTFTASVAVVAPGGGTPTGTVAFKEGSTTLDTETLGSSGVVSFTTAALAVGFDTITAVYSGDPNFVTSSSSTTESVGQASTTTSLSISSTSSTVGQSVTLTATIAVVAPGAGGPTGQVEFFDGSTSLGKFNLIGNVAQFSTSTLAAGTHTLTAQYLGDTNFSESTSPAQSLDVSSPLSVTSIAGASPNPRNTPLSSIDVTFNEPITLSNFTDSALTLTDNGGSNLITSAVSISSVSGSTYQINGLAGLTSSQGLYTLTVNAVAINDQNGYPGTGSMSTSWLMDTTPPASIVSPLPSVETSLNFPVTVTGTVPSEPAGSPMVDIASFAVYVSTNGGSWNLWQTLTPSAGTPNTASALFIGTSNTVYAFYSVATDNAGNAQAYKPTNEASTDLPNLNTPSTLVTSSSTYNGNGTFTLNLTGTDTGGNGLAYFEVYVAIDAQAPVLVAPAIPAGVADNTGTYHATISYGIPLGDYGASHSYRFYSTGIDVAGLQEPTHSAPGDVILSASYSEPAAAQVAVTGLTVENGAAERSYIRYLDLNFDDSNPALLQAIVDSVNSPTTANPAELILTQYNLNGGGTGVPVSLAGLLKVIDNAIEIDFGAGGIDPTGVSNANNTTTADGYYTLTFTPPSGQGLPATHSFYRLLGDVNGDEVVDQNDLNEIAAARGQSVSQIASAIGQSATGLTPLSMDVNGDGSVNTTDLALATRSKGHKLSLGSGQTLG